MQDTAQHCDQLGAFREIMGHQELPQNVHQVLDVDFGGAGVELSLPHQGHLQVADAVFKRGDLETEEMLRQMRGGEGRGLEGQENECRGGL